MLFCPGCGEEIKDENANFCQECGKKLDDNNEEDKSIFEDNKSKEVKETKIDKDFSQDWERCPRCGSEKTEKIGGFWATLTAGFGCGSTLIFLSLLVLWPLFFLGLVIIVFSAIGGLINMGRPDFKCKNCGAEWERDKSNSEDNDFLLDK